MPSVEYSCQQIKKARLRSAIGTLERRLNSGLTSIIPMLKNEGENILASLFCVERFCYSSGLEEEALHINWWRNTLYLGSDLNNLKTKCLLASQLGPSYFINTFNEL